MDGSVVGRGCMALMIHVVYKGRALPLAWRVRHSPKGHCPETLHIEVVELLSQLIPEGAKVVFLGDGECDGTDLQSTLHEMGWSYVCRTAMSTMATWHGKTFRLATLGACLKPGRLIELQDVHCTRDAYGPIRQLGAWLKSVLTGHYRYDGVPRNMGMLRVFRECILRYWCQTLRRRSQRHCITWQRIDALATQWLPPPHILHPYPAQRLRVMTQGKSPVR